MNYLKSGAAAKIESESLFPTYCEQLNGKGGAFRHAHWNALASESLGINTTNLLTTKHEEKDKTLHLLIVLILFDCLF